MKNLLLLLSFITIFSSSVFSQETWDLQKCITHALENNIQIKQQQLQTEIDQNNLKQTKNDLLPSLNSSVGENINFGRNIDYATNTYVNETTYSTSMGVSSNVSIFKGFEKMHQTKKSDFSLQASLAELEQIKNNIQLNIASAYLQILYNNEQVATTKDQIESTKLQSERTKLLIEAGKLPNGDLLEIQAQLAQEELQLVNNENALETSYLTLSQLLEFQSPKGFKIEIPEVNIENHLKNLLEVETTYQKAMDVLPNIRKSEQQLNATKEDLAIAKSYYYPSLSTNLGINTGYSSTFIIIDATDPSFGLTKPFMDQLANNYGAYIGFSLQIPIFNRFQVKTGISNAKIRIQQSEYNLEISKKNLYKDIQQAYSDATAALKKYYATQKSVESLTESFRYTQEKFNAGLLNSIDFNLSKKNLSNAQSELLIAKYEYVFKSNILNFYIGNPFSL